MPESSDGYPEVGPEGFVGIVRWIAVGARGTVRVLMTGPDGFERSVGFGPDEDTAIITEMVGASLED